MRRVVTVEVEPGLADRDRLRVVEQGAEVVELLRVAVRGLMRVDAEGGEHSRLPLGDREGGPARVEPRADRDDAIDTGLSRPHDDEVGSVSARVEMRMRVDHSADRIRSTSSSAIAGSSFLKSGRGSRSGRPAAIF